MRFAKKPQLYLDNIRCNALTCQGIEKNQQYLLMQNQIYYNLFELQITLGQKARGLADMHIGLFVFYTNSFRLKC